MHVFANSVKILIRVRVRIIIIRGQIVQTELLYTIVGHKNIWGQEIKNY